MRSKKLGASVAEAAESRERTRGLGELRVHAARTTTRGDQCDPWWGEVDEPRWSRDGSASGDWRVGLEGHDQRAWGSR